MRLAFGALLAGAMAFGCKKDPVELFTLTTNPFDRDYTGPPVVEVDSIYLVIEGEDTSQYVSARVRVDLLPVAVDYVVEVEELSQGSLAQYPNASLNPANVLLHRTDSAEVGTNYCYEFTLRDPGTGGAARTTQPICEVAGE
jgi:hypothetical protein